MACWLRGARSRTDADIAPSLDKTKTVTKLKYNDWEPKLRASFPDIVNPIASLLCEFSEDDASKRTWPKSAYADIEDMKNVQGWFPLYLEWEVEYYHISWTKWEFRPNSTGGWRYGIRKGEVLANSTVGADRRTLHGRTLITPQSGATLRARLDQLFAQTNPEQLKANGLQPADQAALLNC